MPRPSPRSRDSGSARTSRRLACTGPAAILAADGDHASHARSRTARAPRGLAADPRRAPAVPRGPSGGDPDLGALRAQLMASLAEHYGDADLGPVDEAFDLAVEAHEGQRRATGEPYVTHPIASAQILAELGIDPIAIEAALLHDVPEDTEYSLTDVEERFGAEVAQLVDGVTKLSKFSTHSHEQQQAENIRKMFLAMAQDIRVVLIKLADRLHNMRTLYGAAVREAAAHRPPDDGDLRAARRAARDLADEVGARGPRVQGARAGALPRAGQAARHAAQGPRELHRARDRRAPAAASRPPASRPTSQGRPKHIYSIWKKMQRKSAEFGEIYDVYAIRLLVDEVRDCYAALGIVHSLWRPIPGQFDDYIAVPKNNLYQSLHTAVIALDGKPLEIQIRTHADAPGLARSASPRTGATRKAPSPTASTTPSSPGCASSWTGSATSPTRPSSSRASSSTSSRTRSSCSRPKGDIKDLPAGATPLDFAYRIHTDVGHRTIGAKVNNRLVPLDYRLKNGDIVEIVTTKGEHGPSRDWLNVVRTSHAREKIRQWFKRKDRDENIVHGRESLERELRRLARTSIAAVGPDRDRRGRPRPYNYETLDDFYAAIGYGAIGAQTVVMRLGVVDDGQSTLPTVAPPQQLARDRRRPGQGRRRPPRPLRQVLPPDPGRPDRRVHHPRQGRHGPPPDLPDGRQRARGQPADRGRVGGRADPDLPDRHPRRGLRPDRPALATSPRSWPRTRSTSWPPTSA